MATANPTSSAEVAALVGDETRIDPATFAAALGGCSRTHLYKLRKTDPKFPAPVEQRHRRTRWRLADVRAYLAAQQPQGVTQ